MKEYFSHDYFSRNDKKIVSMSMKHGVAGIGIYWCIVEMLYEEFGYLPVNEYERISFELRTTPETVKSIVEDFGLFEIEGDMFFSPSAIGRIKKRMEKSEKARESVNARWAKDREKRERNTNV